MVKLQKDLSEQSKSLCRTHLDLLLGRLRGAVGSGIKEGYGAQLEALLFTMGDREVQPGMPQNVEWMDGVVEEISHFIPGVEVGVHGVSNDTCNTTEMLQAAEEAERMAQPGIPDQALSSWQDPSAIAEVNFLCGQEGSVLLHQAQNYL